MGGGYMPTNTVQSLAAGAAFISFINVFGGFIVTKRSGSFLCWSSRYWSVHFIPPPECWTCSSAPLTPRSTPCCSAFLPLLSWAPTATPCPRDTRR